MTQALLVSNVILWGRGPARGVVVALVRQIGVLYERVAPAGALMVGRGPAVGEAGPIVHAEDLAGTARRGGWKSVRMGGQLLFFLSPTCPVCKTLSPCCRSIVRARGCWLDVVLAGDGPTEEHEAFVEQHHLEADSLCPLAGAGNLHQVGKTCRTPSSSDAAGVILAKGLVNTREHLESLVRGQGPRGGIDPGLSPPRRAWHGSAQS